MFSSIRKRITYTNVVLTVAVVFAMSGAAYAAGKYVITSTKQIKPSVLASLKGANGKNGANGAPGPEGKAGPAGPQGPEGKEGKGTPGAVGKEGAAGTPGATGAAGPAGPAGPSGPTGPKGTAGAPGLNGATGPAGPSGPTGSPWPAGGTLPSGATETGAWAIFATAANKSGLGIAETAISFPIQLTEKAISKVIGMEEGAGEPHADLPHGCKGNFKEPQAEPGYLCLFVSESSKNLLEPPAVFSLETTAEGEAGKTGALIALLAFEKEVLQGKGTWAVTGN